VRRPRLRRPTRRTAALAGVVAAGLVGAVFLVLGLFLGEEPAVVAEAPGPVARPTGSAAPSPEAAPTSTTPVARYTPSSAVHVRIPAVGLDLPVLPLTPDDGVIDPPLLTAAYYLEPYGHPVGAADGADNTLYLAAHSAGHGDDGFDPLLTDGHRDSALAAGDVVEVSTPEGTVAYTVQRTERVAKEALPSAADVWAAVPGRLVLITCFQHAGKATENLVVFAEAVH
jgi:sortase (surface protein transpeptidase)